MADQDFPHVVRSAQDVGCALRESRRRDHVTISDVHARSGLSPRFLSELERGKSTAQLGKTIAALECAGLQLAVVPAQRTGAGSASRSERMGLSFPYDWSNAGMPERVFIHKVLERGRFDDVRKLVRHMGFDRVMEVLPEVAPARLERVCRQLNNIQRGRMQAIMKTAAGSHNDDSSTGHGAAGPGSL